MVDVSKGELEKPIGLDTTLDDIEDLPQFIVPLSGAYTLNFSGINDKEINDKEAFDCDFTVEEVHELTEEANVAEGEAAPKVGDKFNLPYFKGNKFSTGLFKSDILKPIASHFQLKTVGEVVAAVKDIKVMMIVKRSYNKKADRYFAKIKKLQVL